MVKQSQSLLANKKLLLVIFQSWMIVIISGLALSPSPKLLADSKWQLVLNIGREQGTWMPSDWAASGARLVLPMTVCFRESLCGDSSNERLLDSNPANLLEVLSEPTFVNATLGQQVVAVESGGWCLTRDPKDEDTCKLLLRFFLDFPEEAIRNDVVLPPGRVFFTTHVWLQDELNHAKKTIAATREELKGIETEIDTMKNQHTAVLSQLVGIRSRVLLTEKRILLREKLNRKQESMPLEEDGGDNDIVVEKQGRLFVKRQGGLLGMREEYHILGTIAMTRLILPKMRWDL